MFAIKHVAEFTNKMLEIYHVNSRINKVFDRQMYSFDCYFCISETNNLLCFTETLNGHMLTGSYFNMVKTLYFEAAEEKIIGNFLEAGLKIRLCLKMRVIVNLKNRLKA